jgi:hypothetical protein
LGLVQRPVESGAGTSRQCEFIEFQTIRPVARPHSSTGSESCLERGRGRFRSHFGGDRQVDNGASRLSVMVDQWTGPLGENRQFPTDVVVAVVATFGPISTDIRPDPCDDDLLAAFEGHDRVNMNDSANRLGLSHMARQAIEHSLHWFFGAQRLEKPDQDSLRQGKMVVFQQGTGLKNRSKKGQFVIRKSGQGVLVGYNATEIGAEVKMAEGPLAQAFCLDPIAQGRLARPGGAQKKDTLMLRHSIKS